MIKKTTVLAVAALILSSLLLFSCDKNLTGEADVISEIGKEFGVTLQEIEKDGVYIRKTVDGDTICAASATVSKESFAALEPEIGEWYEEVGDENFDEECSWFSSLLGEVEIDPGAPFSRLFIRFESGKTKFRFFSWEAKKSVLLFVGAVEDGDSVTLYFGKAD